MYGLILTIAFVIASGVGAYWSGKIGRRHRMVARINRYGRDA